MNFAVAFKRENICANAIQKITVMLTTNTMPENAINASSSTRNVGKSRSFVGSSRIRKFPPLFRDTR